MTLAKQWIRLMIHSRIWISHVKLYWDTHCIYHKFLKLNFLHLTLHKKLQYHAWEPCLLLSRKAHTTGLGLLLQLLWPWADQHLFGFYSYTYHAFYACFKVQKAETKFFSFPQPCTKVVRPRSDRGLTKIEAKRLRIEHKFLASHFWPQRQFHDNTLAKPHCCFWYESGFARPQ